MADETQKHPSYQIRPGHGGQVHAVDVKPSDLASVQLADGHTYTFFYDQETRPPTLKYLYGPQPDASYSVLAVQLVDAQTSVKNDNPTALAAALNAGDVHLFYADDQLVITHIVFSLAAKTWKIGTFVAGAKIAPRTGITAVGAPVLKVHYVSSSNEKTITEAYCTQGTWTARELTK